MGILLSSNTGGSFSLPNGGGVEDSLPTSTVMAYDYSDSVCYAAYAATAIQNVITTPADGAAQADYDGLISAGTNFQNLLGKSNAYLLKGTPAEHSEFTARTTFTDSMHKAGAAFGINLQFHTFTETDLTNAFFTTAGGVANTGRRGVALYRTNATTIILEIMNGSGSTYGIQATFTITPLATHTDYSMTAGYDAATGVANLWINGTKYTSTGNTLTSPSVLQSGFTPRFDYGGGSDGLEVGTRFYSGSLYNAAPSDADEAKIRAAWEKTHNRTYVN